MEITDIERLERYEKASVIQKNLYAGSASGIALKQIADKNKLPEAAYKDFATIFGDVVLGFYSYDNLQASLLNVSSISPYITTTFLDDLQTLLGPLLETISGQVVSDSNSPDTSSGQNSKQFDLPNDNNTIPTLRTMAGDGKQIGYQNLAEATYSSSQDTLIKRDQ